MSPYWRAPAEAKNILAVQQGVTKFVDGDCAFMSGALYVSIKNGHTAVESKPHTKIAIRLSVRRPCKGWILIQSLHPV